MEGTEQFDPNGMNDIEKDITDMRDYDSVVSGGADGAVAGGVRGSI